MFQNISSPCHHDIARFFYAEQNMKLNLNTGKIKSIHLDILYQWKSNIPKKRKEHV